MGVSAEGSVPSALSRSALPESFLGLGGELLVTRQFPTLVRRQTASDAIVLVAVRGSVRGAISALMAPYLDKRLT